MTQIDTIQDLRAEFIEKIGMIAQNEGVPRIAGRLLGLLIFDGEAVAFGDLANSLQVSRGSISSSVRLLEERSLVKRVAKPGERQDYFQLADNPYAMLLGGVIKRISMAKADIDSTLNRLPDSAADNRKRLQAYSAFYRAMETGLGDALKILSSDD